LCVTNLDAKSFERGVACSPGLTTHATFLLCLVRKVRFFRHAVKTNSKIHISIGHATELCTCTFFGGTELATDPSNLAVDDLSKSDFPSIEYDDSADFQFQAELQDEGLQWALFQFQKPTLVKSNSLIVGSKLVRFFALW
jgi:selenocysteine-specific elongation factor